MEKNKNICHKEGKDDGKKIRKKTSTEENRKNCGK